MPAEEQHLTLEEPNLCMECRFNEGYGAREAQDSTRRHYLLFETYDTKLFRIVVWY